MTQKQRGNTNAARLKKTKTYWKQAIESGKLEGHDLTVAIRSLERLEQAERTKKERNQPKSKAAKGDRPESRATVTNPGVFWAFETCRKSGFSGTFRKWTEYLKSIPHTDWGLPLHSWWNIDWRAVGDRAIFQPGDLLPR